MQEIVMSNKMSFFIFFIVAVIAGCGGGGGTVNTSRVSRQDFQSSQEVSNINSRLLSQQVPANSSAPDGYLIGPADLLEIRVFESENMTSKVRVSSSGDITLPLLDNIYVEGFTVRDTEVKIENLLREGEYIDDPHVSVFVAEYKSKVVSVMGYVNQPGVYELLNRRTLIDALASAQGLSDKAGTLVYVTRNEADGSKNSYLVELDELISSKNPENNIELKPGDLVFVPEAANVFVEGAVGKPGAYPINEGKTTLSEAITMAGGVSSVADKGDIKLIRSLASGGKEVVALNMNRIRNGEEEDPILNEKDAIVVGASSIKSLIYGIKINLFGFGGFGYDPPQ
jgi:polysaccharide export outer membrane protein